MNTTSTKFDRRANVFSSRKTKYATCLAVCAALWSVATLPAYAQAPASALSATAPAPGQIQDGQTFSQAQIDQLVAPIALYPDSLLTQLLMASTYPLEVVEAARWSHENPSVMGQALENAMQ